MTDYEGPKMTSAQFRRSYATIGYPVIVTANGHPIGVWVPSTDEAKITIQMGPIQKFDPVNMHARFEPSKREIIVDAPNAQARRDVILHKINRGG